MGHDDRAVLPTHLHDRTAEGTATMIRYWLDRLHRAAGIPNFRHALSPLTYVDDALFSWVWRATGRQVLDGPFRGLVLTETSGGSELKPKILGSYENELHPVFASLSLPDNSTIMDIGADDGYYTIGFARQYPNSRVVAVEADPVRCARLQNNVDRNNAGTRVSICCCRLGQESTTLGDFVQTLGLPSMIKCDIEGAEYGLLDDVALDALTSAATTLVIELHLSANREAQLTNRLRSHGYEVTTIEQRSNKPFLFGRNRPMVSIASRLFWCRWTDEHRHGSSFTHWLVARLVSSSAAS